MNQKTRRVNTGEPGNGGLFAAVANGEPRSAVLTRTPVVIDMSNSAESLDDIPDEAEVHLRCGKCRGSGRFSGQIRFPGDDPQGPMCFACRGEGHKIMTAATARKRQASSDQAIRNATSIIASEASSVDDAISMLSSDYDLAEALELEPEDEDDGLPEFIRSSEAWDAVQSVVDGMDPDLATRRFHEMIADSAEPLVLGLNRYAGECNECGGYVPVGEGSMTMYENHDETTVWSVVCSDCRP